LAPSDIPPVPNNEEGYKTAAKTFYPAIAEADVVIAYVPDGIGEHTRRDIQFAESLGKKIVLIEAENPPETLRRKQNKPHEESPMGTYSQVPLARDL